MKIDDDDIRYFAEVVIKARRGEYFDRACNQLRLLLAAKELSESV